MGWAFTLIRIRVSLVQHPWLSTMSERANKLFCIGMMIGIMWHGASVSTSTYSIYTCHRHVNEHVTVVSLLLLASSLVSSIVLGVVGWIYWQTRPVHPPATIRQLASADLTVPPPARPLPPLPVQDVHPTSVKYSVQDSPTSHIPETSSVHMTGPSTRKQVTFSPKLVSVFEVHINL